MTLQTRCFPNGLRLIHQQEPIRCAYLGLMINVGTRDEREDEAGMAHFLEHILFKGTTHRHAYHILSRLDDVGGDLNAFTSKEDTTIQASFLSEYYPRALELFSDIIFNSTFPEKEIEKEKDVVLEEIDSYRDSPSELIFDDFEELIFNNHPLGRNILGTEKEVESITRAKVQNFVRHHYQPDRMVISSVGNISFELLVEMVERYFGMHINHTEPLLRQTPPLYKPVKKSVVRSVHQAHCAIGNIAYGQNEEKRVALSLLVNILGGPGMNTRLNLNIREKYGLTYNIEANYSAYSDIGSFMVYFGCDVDETQRCTELVMRELEHLCREPLGPVQLRRAQRQAVGQITLSADNWESVMISNGKSYMVYDTVEELDVLCGKILAITPEMLLEVAGEIFAPERQSLLLYQRGDE